MIAWSIEIAKKAGCFDSIIVSTDDLEIRKIASHYGAQIPFVRPSELSGDCTSTKAVIVHAIKTLGLDKKPDTPICCLYATAPFTQPDDLNKSHSILQSSNKKTVIFAATSFAFPVQRAIRINENGYSQPVDINAAESRSQDLEPLFHDAGQFYLARASTWNSISNIFNFGRPLILPRWRVQDIDTEEDWIRAEFMHKALFT